MALHVLGTTTTTALTALGGWSEALSDADINAIGYTITGDGIFAARGGSPPVAGAAGILATGNTHSNTTIDTLNGTGGPPLAAIQVGMPVLGSGIPPATYVTQILSPTSVQISQAATATATVNLAFGRPHGPMLSRAAQLEIPGRGILKVLNGDVVAIDPTTGWVILLSAAAINAAGSFWNFV